MILTQIYKVNEDEEKKRRLERAQKFGLAVPEIEEEKKKKRAEKFGQSQQNGNKKLKA